MTIISMALVAVSLNIGLLMQYGHGQNITMTQEQRKAIIDYCFQHADRLNPLQDLIDKGFLPEGFNETCKSVKQTYDKVQSDLEIENQTANSKAKNVTVAYLNCYNNPSNGKYLIQKEIEACENIIREYCDNPVYAQYMYNWLSRKC
jgi:hypothetical protein